MTIAIVAAVARNGVIGAGGELPWRIPGDLRRFRRLTLGGTVVMGRRTFDSIGKALDGRRNIVVTRRADFSAPGAERADSLQSALALARENGGESRGIFIIGGGEVYAEALRLGLAERMILTEVDGEFAGDVFFPPFSRDEWREESRERGEGDIPHWFVRRRRTG